MVVAYRVYDEGVCGVGWDCCECFGGAGCCLVVWEFGDGEAGGLEIFVDSGWKAFACVFYLVVSCDQVVVLPFYIVASYYFLCSFRLGLVVYLARNQHGFCHPWVACLINEPLRFPNKVVIHHDLLDTTMTPRHS